MIKLFLLFIFTVSGSLISAQVVHHQIHARVEPVNHEIYVTDSLTVPVGKLDKGNSFVVALHRDLHPEIKDPEISLVQIDKIDESMPSYARMYKITVLDTDGEFICIPFTYYGKIIQNNKNGEHSSGGDGQSPAIIDSKGVYLKGSSLWVPRLEDSGLFTFNLKVGIDESWHVVSQGTRTMNDLETGRRIVRYDSPDLMDEVFLVAGRWTEYSLQWENVLVQAFLRTPDEQLANRYLNVTSHYLKLFRELIGDYPFSKFALVENFWESGFGMPSFTLLGEKIIRFPFILHSSYPHELLHNYWGNSVYVDYEKGNWCEGITSYMADHLIKEQRGEGADYRRNTLLKFTNYVNETNDFPVSQFRARTNSAGEAIGYGKVLMFNEMLRNKFGDEVFKKAWAKLYRDFRFSYASFDDIRSCFEEVTEQDLKWFFDQWLNRKGAPSIQLANVKVSRSGDQYNLDFQLQQVQKEDIFRLNTPVVIYLENKKEAVVAWQQINARENNYTLTFDERPLKVSVDPQYNVMRRLDPSEMPTTISKVMGSIKSAIILPQNSDYFNDYMRMSMLWQKMQSAQGRELEIFVDADIEKLPSDKPVWILGFENKFYKQVEIPGSYKNFFTAAEQEKVDALIRDNSFVYTIPNPENSDQTVGFIGSNKQKAISGLTRKLMHYGQYGFLGFEGDAPDNVMKGVFPAMHSKMDVVLRYEDNPPIKSKLKKRPALTGSP